MEKRTFPIQRPGARGRWSVHVRLVALAFIALTACKPAGETDELRPEPVLADEAPSEEREITPDDAPPPAADEAEEFVIYLREGESVSDIARWSASDSATIREQSGLSADEEVVVGTRLVLEMDLSRAARFMEQRLARLGPRRHTPPTPPRPLGTERRRRVEEVSVGEPATFEIRVRRDEMLGLYARWAGTTINSILAVNPDLDPDRMAVGSVVVIPLDSDGRLDFEDAREAWHSERSGTSADP